MNTLISILFLTLQLQSAPTAPTITMDPCSYFEVVDGPSSNGEVCCVTLATNPGITIGIVYTNSTDIYEAPSITSDSETGFFELCMPLKFDEVLLNHPKLIFPCIMENPCN